MGVPLRWLGDHHASYRLRAVAFAFEGIVYLIQKPLNALWGGLDIFDADPVHSRFAVVSGYPVPRRHKHVLPIDPVVQRVKPVLRRLLRLDVESLPQSEDSFG